MLASEQNTKLCLLEYKCVHEIHMQPSVSEACDKILKTQSVYSGAGRKSPGHTGLKPYSLNSSHIDIKKDGTGGD